MNPTSKKIIAIAGSVAILAIAYFGSYLPLRKAQMFISTLQSLQATPASSLQDLAGRLSIPLSYPSPIGQEELVRNTANSVLNFVQQNPSASSSAEIIQFLRSYYDPILSRGRGMSFGQDLYLMGAIHEIAFARTGLATFLTTAQQFYEEGNHFGPDRPQPLYGLFDIYRAEGNVASTTGVANHILTNWPADMNIRNSLAQFLANVQAPATKKKK